MGAHMPAHTCRVCSPSVIDFVHSCHGPPLKTELQHFLTCCVLAGNPIKFGLGLVSIGFDIIFILQHYIWFHPEKSAATRKDAVLPLDARQHQQQQHQQQQLEHQQEQQPLLAGVDVQQWDGDK